MAIPDMPKICNLEAKPDALHVYIQHPYRVSALCIVEYMLSSTVRGYFDFESLLCALLENSQYTNFNASLAKATNDPRFINNCGLYVAQGGLLLSEMYDFLYSYQHLLKHFPLPINSFIALLKQTVTRAIAEKICR